jgi:hypothetical protein
LASDLAKKVTDALLDIFFDSYLRSLVRKSASRSVPPHLEPAPAVAELPPLPQEFSQGTGVLFAGAGISMGAGFPSALLLSEYLGRQLKLGVTGDQMLSRHRFSDIVELAETEIGRPKVISSIKALVDPPQPVGPTGAHLTAVKLFKVIVTTNYDELFEDACRRQGLKCTVKTPSHQHAETDSDVTIYKLNGTISQPDTLMLTDNDAVRAGKNVGFWNDVREALTSKPLAVVGHSLRDDTSRHLLERRDPNMPGVYVTPSLDRVDEITLRQFRLSGFRADAEQFMSTLSPSV